MSAVLLHGADEDVFEVRNEARKALHLAAVNQCPQQVPGLPALLQLEQSLVAEREDRGHPGESGEIAFRQIRAHPPGVTTVVVADAVERAEEDRPPAVDEADFGAQLVDLWQDVGRENDGHAL